MNLYAFDCDGTIAAADQTPPVGPETSAIVKADSLRDLKNKGHIVLFVSRADRCKHLWSEFPFYEPPRPYSQEDDRMECLLECKRHYPDCTKYFYISDNPNDDQRAVKVGFIFIHPNIFYQMDLQ